MVVDVLVNEVELDWRVIVVDVRMSAQDGQIVGVHKVRDDKKEWNLSKTMTMTRTLKMMLNIIEEPQPIQIHWYTPILPSERVDLISIPSDKQALPERIL